MTLLRSLGPALPRPPAADLMKAALGAGLGLAFANLILWLLPHAAAAPVLLIAPFGASAFLIYVVPSSPLAQPWSVVVGNAVSALTALLVLQLPLPGLVLATLAVALAVPAMAVTRAQHPPGGAVALVTVLAALGGHAPGWAYLLTPVTLGSAALAGFGILWARATGRAYPFRTPAPPPATHGTADPAPLRRLTPPPEALAAALTQLRLAANIGVEDLARLIDRAEADTPGLAPGALTAARVMSRDVVSVSPDTPLPKLADLFRGHGFKTLPVLDGSGHYLGIVPQVATSGLADPDVTAADLSIAVQTLPPSAPLDQVIAALSDGAQEVVPVLDAGHLQGIVTRSDLIAALLHDLGLR